MRKFFTDAATKIRKVRRKRERTEQPTFAVGESGADDPSEERTMSSEGGSSQQDRSGREMLLTKIPTIIIPEAEERPDATGDGDNSSDTRLATPTMFLTPSASPSLSDSYLSSDEEGGALQPVASGTGRKLVALNTCGDLERALDASSFPLALKKEIHAVRDELLWQYPPFYDFCVIASDDDYDLSVQFKDHLMKTFRLIGCTLYDGFITFGADSFDCYELMMDQSHKAFFLVTNNFSQNAFCRRLQSGAVFQCLMSKVKKDREKCVPVYPYGMCKAPLALSGVAGLVPSQQEMMKRLMSNTYSPLVRELRVQLDNQNYEQRCIEFKNRVVSCVEEYCANNALEQASSSQELQSLPESLLNNDTDFVELLSAKISNAANLSSLNDSLAVSGQSPKNSQKDRQNENVANTKKEEASKQENRNIPPPAKKSNGVSPVTEAENSKKCNSSSDDGSREKTKSCDNVDETSDEDESEDEPEEKSKEGLNFGGPDMHKLPDFIGEALKNTDRSFVNVSDVKGQVTIGPTINVTINVPKNEAFQRRCSPKPKSSKKSCSSESD